MTQTDPHQTVNDRAPNWREDGQLYLKRCFSCESQRGMENWAPSVATGTCAFCGWSDTTNTENTDAPTEP